MSAFVFGKTRSVPLNILSSVFIQLMYNKNDHLAKLSIFASCLMPSFAYTTPFPPRPKTPFTYVVYLYSDI